MKPFTENMKAIYEMFKVQDHQIMWIRVLQAEAVERHHRGGAAMFTLLVVLGTGQDAQVAALAAVAAWFVMWLFQTTPAYMRYATRKVGLKATDKPSEV